MGTIFAIDGVDATQSHAAPKVKMSWSCQVDTMAPHVQVPSPPQAYTTRLRQLGITGVTSDQRVILRIHTTAGYATLELQGRHHDAIEVPITASGSNWNFDYRNDDLDVIAVGQIQPGTRQQQIVFSQLVVGDVDLGTPTWTLSELDESGQ